MLLLVLTIVSCKKNNDCYREVDNDSWQHHGFNCMTEPQNYCGCDGKTYTSRCELQKAGVLYFEEGSCK